MAGDPTKRFSNRVENYIRYRPGYPAELIGWLRDEWHLTKDTTIADVGSGTGKLAELFLENGNRVFGVEPNREMREAGARLLGRFDRFTSVDGTAEATTLSGGSVDWIIAGQAFHWFEPQKTRAEFLRILRPDGIVVLVWNDRRDGTPFLQGYERLLRRFATDYEQVNHRRIDAAALTKFFGAAPASKVFPYVQRFDFDGLKGRLLSSSYAPEAGQPGHEEMLAALRRLFDRHQREGYVLFEYETQVHGGRLA